MDPHDQADVMHLQDSRSSALDLSVGCRHTNPMEALDLVKKPSWCGLTSGSRSVNLSESCYIKQTPPHHPEPEEKFHGTPAHDSYSIPLPLINGLPSVAQILSQCSSTDQEFTDYHEEMEEEEEDEEVLMQTKQCHKNAESVLENSILGGRIAHVVLEKHPQDIGSDTVFTKGSSFLSQGSSPAANTLHSTSSAAEQTAIETLASECTKISTESTSSDSDSDVIEVPVSNSRCTTRPNLRPRPTSVIVSDTSGRTLRSSRLKQQVDADRQMNCSPKNVNSIYTMDEAVYETANRRVGAESKSLLSWMESVLIPISPEDSEQDTNSSFPKNLPSTSDAENSSVLKSPETQRSSSSTPSHQEKTPPSKSRKQAKPRPKARPKPRPKPKKQQKRVTPGTKTIKKRRRRKPQPSGPSSMFSPKEPEIKLRFANHKNEKKEARTAVDCFVPYIRMEFSSCTIVNFREEEVVSKKSSHPADSGVIPKTSCLQLGRIGSDARLQETRFCCLCGRTGNVEGLGDLHGPYHRSGAQPICKVDSSPPPVSKQEPDCSDVDSLYSLEDGASQAKRQRKENGSESLEESGVPGEHWIHEDCSIWTAGIFLVKGKLYGLEEAIRLAQGTVCSFCDRVGATLGCFFKDCPQKYHCPCALQSGSALNEENFTMRCPKHKNKVSRMSVSRLKNR